MAKVEKLEDINTFMVALCESPDGDSDHLELQKSLRFDAQDIELGQATYCTVLSTGAAYYGGIVSCVLSRTALVLDFTAKAADVLEVERSFRMDLELQADDLERLRQGLHRLFDDDVQRPGRLIL